jgi:DNA processing protein
MDLSAERLAILRLARSPGIGPVTYKKIVGRTGSADEAVLMWEKISGGKPLASADGVRREMDALHAQGGWCVMHGDADYPHALAMLPDAPLVLSGLGDRTWLDARQVAVVGNRNASASGLQWSRALAAALATHGLTVTSGLARGIDTAAHRGALDAHGGTVAVVGGGVDHVYPRENEKLREEIIAHGCLVSEQPFGMAPMASLFARRNRVIAGLSLGVVVSEGARTSASLITARYALDYNREVWAVPGSPDDPRAGGTNWLLKQGAILIENAEDVVATLPQDLRARAVREPQLPLLEADDAVVEAEEQLPVGEGIGALLGRVAVTVDELVRQSGLGESAALRDLVELELMGTAVREADGRWRKS